MKKGHHDRIVLHLASQDKTLTRFSKKLGKKCGSTCQGPEKRKLVANGIRAYHTMLKIEEGNERRRENAQYYRRDTYEAEAYKGNKIPRTSFMKRRLALKLSRQEHATHNQFETN